MASLLVRQAAGVRETQPHLRNECGKWSSTARQNRVCASEITTLMMDYQVIKTSNKNNIETKISSLLTNKYIRRNHCHLARARAKVGVASENFAVCLRVRILSPTASISLLPSLP